MNNGCVCCTVRGDLIRILNRLLKRKSKFDAIVIETTGLADPAPVAQTFFVDDDLKESLRLDAILTVVDAKHVILHLDEEKPDGAVNEAIQQIAFADKILLNKTDLVSVEEKQNVIDRILEINKMAKIIECQNAAVPLDEILSQHAFDLDNILAMDPTFLKLEEEDDHDHHRHHDHDDCEKCTTGEEHHHHDHEHKHDDCEKCTTGEEHHHHDHKHKHKHHHDTRVTSVGIEVEGRLNMRKFNQWLGTLVQEKGADIYRCKGVLAAQNTEEKIVFHGVHMMLQMISSAQGHGKPWGADETKVCRAVFIGKELDRAALNEGFRSCLVDSE